MILVVDLNPIITTEYYLDKFVHNRLNRAKRVEKKINGEGIFCSDLLSNMNLDYKLMSFCGQKDNCELQRYINKLAFPYHGINISTSTLEALQIQSDKDKAFILSPAPKITQKEIEDFYQAFTEAVNEADAVVIVNGKIYNGLKNFAKNLIRICYRLGKKVIISSENDEIYDLVKEKPYLSILDLKELEEISNLELEFEWEIIRSIKTLLESGVGAALVIDRNKSIYIDKSNALRIRFEANKLLNTKPKKSLIATGFAIGLLKNYDLSMTAKIALASGLSNFNLENRADSSEIKQLMNHIEVEAFNV
ncbi:MAG: hypothetical protein Q4P29_03870 [Tissierellia bacterium]|nr:hypothetical protein [Tissierellia bacterium]